MRIPHYTLVLIIFLFSAQLSFSQKKERDLFSLNGAIIDEANGDSIPFVTIFNESTRRWAIADESGNFSLSVCRGDTLVFSAIGFLGKVIHVQEELRNKKNTVSLASQKYNIDEVKVVGYRNYDDFKKAFIDLDLPESEISKVREKLELEGTVVAIEADYERQVNEVMSRPGVGMSFSSGRLLNQDKLLREKLQLEDAMQRAIDKKYNREIVFELTQLSEDELTNFMGFCNFSMEYLYNATEYDILVKIELKFRLYQATIDTCG